MIEKVADDETYSILTRKRESIIIYNNNKLCFVQLIIVFEFLCRVDAIAKMLDIINI